MNNEPKTLTIKDIMQTIEASKDTPPAPKKPKGPTLHETMAAEQAKQEAADLEARINFARSPEGRRAAILRRLRGM